MDLTYMVIIMITIFIIKVKGTIFKHMNKMSIDMEEILYSSQKEASMLQCAHKCKLIDKGAAIVFRESKCKCVKYTGNGKDINEENIPGAFVNQIIMKNVHGCDKPSKGGCSDICNKNGDTVKCSCQKGYGLSNDEKTCKKIHACDRPSKGGCSQICNKDGDAVKCSCRTGYDMVGTTCKQIVNVALGKYASQSSIINSDLQFAPIKGVDGKWNTHAWTEEEQSPWWQVDLGEVRRIKEIRLSGVEYHDHYNQGLTVYVSNNPSNSWSFCASIGDLPTETYKFQCNSQPTDARFLQIVSNEYCYLEFYEVEIYGY